MIILNLYGNPIAQKRPRFRRTEAYVQTYDPQVKEKETYRWQIQTQFRNTPLQTPLKIEIVFFMPIPASTSAIRKKEMIANVLHHMKRPDVDNMAKFMLDCMNGLVFHDDSQIWDLHCQKIYAEEPGTLIKITPSTHEKPHEKLTFQAETAYSEHLLQRGEIGSFRKNRARSSTTSRRNCPSQKIERPTFRVEEK